MNTFRGKNLLVIGGTGSVGTALVKRLLTMDPAVIRVYSRDEYKQFLVQSDLTLEKNENPALDTDKVRFFLGDVRDKERLKRAMENVDIVFDLAALKHVPACEYNPFEAVKTNVIGTQNVIECAIEEGVSTVLYSSSDKAAGPTNTMGATKLLAERLISAADFHKGPRNTRFFSVRFGNVLNSRGSVIPLFKKQIARGGPVTVTDPNMTRFVMSVPRAVELILKAVEIAHGGETFVFKMPVIKIGDLARGVIELSGANTDTKVIGLRPGEKMYEELLTEEESNRALETEDMFVVLPFHGDCNEWSAHYSYAKRAAIGTYTSEGQAVMSYEELKEILRVGSFHGM
ncbi:MAG: UDP-N-acetylglucosamine 4,6-dehydratase family protein [Candidatus Saccharibacteria bacterium]